MPVDVASYNKQCVEDLFTDMVVKLSLGGVDKYVLETLEAPYLGVDALQIREGFATITSANLGAGALTG